MIDIAGRKIGPDQSCYIVAEIGSAHGGDIRTALKLVDAAKEAGADCCKFQAWNTRRLLSPDSPMYRRVLPLELSEGQFRHIKAHCDDIGITFLCTPDQVEDADMLDDLVPAWKIGSGHLRDLPLLRYVAAKGKPIILSTGMGDMEAVRQAVNELQSPTYGGTPLVLLHCCSQYPPVDYEGEYIWWDPAAVNLRAMDALRNAWPGYAVGFSDHSPVNCISLAAVAMGACVIERHICMPDYHGLDWAVSVEPSQFEAMVRDIRDIEHAMGDGVKRPMEAEAATQEWVGSWRKV